MFRKSCFSICNHFCKKYLFVFFWLVLGIWVNGQKITLRTGDLQLSTPSSLPISRLTAIADSITAGFFFAARFFPNIPLNFLKDLQVSNIAIGEKLAEHTYLIHSFTYPDSIFCANTGIEAIGILPATLKLDERFLVSSTSSERVLDGNQWEGLLEFFPLPDTLKFSEKLIALGLLLEPPPIGMQHVWRVKGTLKAFQAAAQLPFVTWIQPVGNPDHLLNQNGRMLSGAMPLLGNIPNGGSGLTGAGAVIGVGDDTDPTLHPDLMDRIINHTPGIVNNHGAHTAGTIAGGGIIRPTTTGMASGSTVLSQWFSGILQYSANYKQAYGMQLTSNSYGSIVGDCLYAGVYDLYSKQLDQLAYHLPDVLHLFAAGNDGDMVCAPFPNSYQTVLGGYQSAKNIITVGRTDFNQLTSSSSSSGPVKDGRIKPEITGLGILESARGQFAMNFPYETMYGTSMSTPLVAGGLALLCERWKQLKGSEAFPAGLLKLLALNGARDIGQPGLDFRHGFGTLQLNRSLRMLNQNHFFTQSIANGQQKDTVIQIPLGLAQCKIMLYWQDPAAAVLATKSLVHDLDLTITDPEGKIIYPRVLELNPAMVSEVAKEGVDHVNNVEQIVIDFPAAGAYTIAVKATEVLTSVTQHYFVGYDLIPQGMEILSPFAGNVYANNNPLGIPISWEDEGSTGAGTYSIEYSINNGLTWQPIVTGLKDTTRVFWWNAGSIRSHQVWVKLSKSNGIPSVISGKFAVMPYVSFALAPLQNQCEGYIALQWNPWTANNGETVEYEVLKKTGRNMEVVAKLPIASNTYAIGGLNSDSTYYMAVRPVINGISGTYYEAVERKPNNGLCSGNISNGDLKIDAIVFPITGRDFCSNALPNQSPIKVRVKNLDDAPNNAYKVSYSINGGSSVSITPLVALQGGSQAIIEFPPADFSGGNSFLIEAVVTNIGQADPVASNDTFNTIVKRLPNPPLSVQPLFIEDFENASISIIAKNTIGIAETSRWDFQTKDVYGRLRTMATPNNSFSGQRAITLDVSKSPPYLTQGGTALIGTFNLSLYNATSDPIRLRFAYKHHGSLQKPHPDNKVWIRGTDQSNWLELFDLGASQLPVAGTWQQVPSINIAKKLAEAGQNFSSSTQIKFGQYSLVGMADNTHFGGYTFDDIGLFAAEKDLSLDSIISPSGINCQLTSDATIAIKITNTTPFAVANVPVRFRIDGGFWVDEMIPSIQAAASINFEFATKANLATIGWHKVETLVAFAGDNVPQNDTVTLMVLNQSVVNSFPFEATFESSNDGFFAAGIRNSWAWGTPASLRIKSAASGNKVWKTTLIGQYDNEEISYLYSPCFALTGMVKPLVQFDLAYQIEDCSPYGVVCDAAWVEYRLSGGGWQKLGASGEGVNWYDNDAAQAWVRNNQTVWRKANTSLPINNGIAQIRMVLQSDESTVMEGVAVDNFQVFDQNTLSLGWLSVKATQTFAGIVVNWSKLGVAKGDRFTIEKATYPNSTFEAVGMLPILLNEQQSFSFTDQKLFVGQAFYRIKHWSANSNLDVSPILKVEQGELLNPQVWLTPNPVKNSAIVKIIEKGGSVVLSILDESGRVFWKKEMGYINGSYWFTLPIHDLQLANGLYFLSVQGSKGVHMIKWLKQ